MKLSFEFRINTYIISQMQQLRIRESVMIRDAIIIPAIVALSIFRILRTIWNGVVGSVLRNDSPAV